MGRMIAASGLSLAAASPTPVGAASPPTLNLDDPHEKLRVFMKVFTSTEQARVWYWYTGVLDASVNGGPVIPFAAVDTLIRRDIKPTKDGRFELEMFEGTYFHPLGDPKPFETMRNPLNGRTVRPFHYREGPYSLGYDTAGPYDVKTGAHYPGSAMSDMPIHTAGDQVWFSRDYYVDAPNAFLPDQWPLESSGPREAVGSFATHFASLAEAADPAVKTAKSAFHYAAFMGWWPWMLMGQTPGRLAWRADGTKLSSLDQLAPATRDAFAAVHPGLLRERPWEAFVNMPIEYKKLRSPAV